MEIKALEQSVETDLSNAYPNSAESYRHYIDGLNALMDSDYKKAVESLEKAYKIDSTFTFAAFYLAFAYNFGRLSFEEDIRWTRRAYELKDNLPPVYRPWIELWYACVQGDINDIRRYCDIMFESALHNRLYLLDLAVTYSTVLEDFSKAIRAFEKIEALNELWEDDWRYEMYYRGYIWTLLMFDRPEDADRIIEKGLKVLPDVGAMKVLRGAVHIVRGDSIAVKQSEQQVREVSRRYGFGLSMEEYYVGFMYCAAKDSLTAAAYFRKSRELDPGNIASLHSLIDCQLIYNINLEECLELAEYWLEKEPDSWRPRLYVGRCLYKLGRYEEALSYLKEADGMLIGFHMDIMKYLHNTEQALALQEQQ
jgi:tetratricopeptide (TPR) repeat protein